MSGGREIWRSVKESNLRGLKETNLRALLVSKMKLNGLFAMINVCGPEGGDSGFGEIYFPSLDMTEVWVKYFYNVATDTYNNVIINAPLRLNVGDFFEAGDPNDPTGQSYMNNWWFNQIICDLLFWSPSVPPITNWEITTPWLSPYQTSQDITGFVIWPNKVPSMIPHPPGHTQTTVECVSLQRYGASITLLRAGITGCVSIHDIIARPTNALDGGLLGPAQNVPSKFKLVNIINTVSESIGPTDSEHIFSCPSDKVMCFWLGKKFSDLPNDGPPFYRPIQFNPMDYGLLSSYAPVNPPYP